MLDVRGAGAGVGMLRGVLGFLVFGFLFFGFLVYWFLCFGVLWFLVFRPFGFKVSRMYQTSISCFSIDIELISAICKIILDGSSGLSGARLFATYQKSDFHNFEICQNMFLI